MLRADVLSIGLAAVCVVAITVLAGLGQPVPDVLPTIALVAAGAGGGAAIPQARATRRSRSVAAVDVPADAPADAPADDAPPAPPVAVTTTPVPGVTSTGYGRADL